MATPTSPGSKDKAETLKTANVEIETQSGWTSARRRRQHPLALHLTSTSTTVPSPPPSSADTDGPPVTLPPVRSLLQLQPDPDPGLGSERLLSPA